MSVWPCRLNPLLSEDTQKPTWNLQQKHLKDPQTVRNNIIWPDEPQVSCLKENRLQSTIPKVKCAVAASCYGAAFQQHGQRDSSE